MTGTPAGLCETCRHARRIVSGRGSQFWLCRRSEKDPAFARYPALPVLACTGYDPSIAIPPGRPAPDRTTPPHTD